MSWEQDPWAVPGGAYMPSKRGSSRRDGRGGGLRWLWLLVACFAGYAGWTLVFGEHGILTLRRLAAREVALKAEIAQTHERVQQLETEVSNIDETRQRRARLEFGMARKNEIIYLPAPADSVNGGGGSGGGQTVGGGDAGDHSAGDRP